MEITSYRYDPTTDIFLLEISGTMDYPKLSEFVARAIRQELFPQTCRKFLIYDDGIIAEETTSNATENIVKIHQEFEEALGSSKIAFYMEDIKSHAKVQAIRGKIKAICRAFYSFDEAFEWLKNDLHY